MIEVAHRHVAQRARNVEALFAIDETAAQRFRLAPLGFDHRGARPGGHHHRHRIKRVDVADGVDGFVTRAQRVDRVRFADMQRGGEFAAHQLAPGQLGADAVLHRVGRDAGALQHLAELLRRDVLARRHAAEGLVHLGIADHQTVLLGFGDPEPVVDQLLDDLLARRLLVRRGFVQLGALLDVVGGDRHAVGHHHDLRPAKPGAASTAAARTAAAGQRRKRICLKAIFGIASSIVSGRPAARCFARGCCYSPPIPVTPWLSEVPPSVRRLNCSMIVWLTPGLPL